MRKSHFHSEEAFLVRVFLCVLLVLTIMMYFGAGNYEILWKFSWMLAPGLIITLISSEKHWRRSLQKEGNTNQGRPPTKDPVDQEYLDLRSESTAWYHRLTATYNFTLATGTLLIGFQVNLFLKYRDTPGSTGLETLLYFFILCSLVLIVTTVGAALMARTISLIFRQAGYLSLFYEGKWEKRIKEFVDSKYFKERLPEGLRWLKPWTESRLVTVLLVVLAISSIAILFTVLIKVKIYFNIANAIILFVGASLFWGILYFFLLWIYRLWYTNEHFDLWVKALRSWWAG